MISIIWKIENLQYWQKSEPHGFPEEGVVLIEWEPFRVLEILYLDQSRGYAAVSIVSFILGLYTDNLYPLLYRLYIKFLKISNIVFM